MRYGWSIYLFLVLPGCPSNSEDGRTAQCVIRVPKIKKYYFAIFNISDTTKTTMQRATGSRLLRLYENLPASI